MVDVPKPNPDLYGSQLWFPLRKGTDQAILKAKEIITSGKRCVVAMSIERFFDRVDHDIFFPKIARKSDYARVLMLIRRFLQAGLIFGGIISPIKEYSTSGTAFIAFVKHPSPIRCFDFKTRHE